MLFLKTRHSFNGKGASAYATMSSVGFSGKWLWPTTPMEEFSEIGHQRGTFLMCYQLSLCSSSPLSSEHVQESLEHLYRKVPNLRVCYGTRDGVLWFREAVNRDIDFQVVETEDVWEVMNCLRTYRYNSETGPLWCARLIPDSRVSSEKNGYHYDLMLGFHHGITDGFSAMKTCGFIVSLLNDVLAGNHINDEEQLAEYTNHEETERVISEKRSLLENDLDLQKRLLSEIERKKDTKSIFREAVKSAEGGKDRTRSVLRCLDEVATNKFIKKCRSEEVTVHSAFTALANVAMADLIAEVDSRRESYLLINNHVINIRRYWSGDVSRSFGCHIVAPMTIFTEVQPFAKGKFWDFARSVHLDLQKNLKEGVILQNQALAKLKNSPKPTARDFFYPLLPCDFSTSNLGDVTPLVTEGGDHVKPTKVLRSVSIHFTNASWSHLFNTFQGRLIHVLDYNNATMSKELAEKYSDNLFRRLVEVTEQ